MFSNCDKIRWILISAKKIWTSAKVFNLTEPARDKDFAGFTVSQQITFNFTIF